MHPQCCPGSIRTSTPAGAKALLISIHHTAHADPKVIDPCPIKLGNDKISFLGLLTVRYPNAFCISPTGTLGPPPLDPSGPSAELQPSHQFDPEEASCISQPFHPLDGQAIPTMRSHVKLGCLLQKRLWKRWTKGTSYCSWPFINSMSPERESECNCRLFRNPFNIS